MNELRPALRTAPGGRRFRDLIQQVDAIIWEADATTWQYTFVSQRAEEILGYSVEQWLTEPEFAVKLIHPEVSTLAGWLSSRTTTEPASV